MGCEGGQGVREGEPGFLPGPWADREEPIAEIETQEG